ncbi:MAG TPA: wax ester/triacylglycerol synthase family O-acyltransferase [Solirubrobacteraceae bacterium]|jgi:WS/DGAT/MGAT family acyltransferase
MTTTTAAPLDWGTNREMNGLEALMWRAEADPRLRSTICGVQELDATPDWERLVAAHDWASRLVPRFRQRVVEPALGLGVPVWANDPDFDLHYHVRRARLPEGGGFAALLAAAEQIAMTPFDRARPLWEAVLFEGLPDGRSAYLLKLHHATTDGLGSVQLLSQLYSRTREPNPRKVQVAPPPPDGLTSSRALAEQALQGAGALPRTVAGGGRAALRALADPLHRGRAALRFGRSLQRVLADPDADASPLLRERSLSWRWLALDLAFADLRAASKAAGGSLNDAYVAALLGGFRRYHAELGVPLDRMPVAIPMSVRTDDDAAGGNRFAGARLALPAGIADPAQRIAAVRDAVRGVRDEPALNALGLIAPGLARLPAPLISQLAGGLTRSNDLQASNVPGLREDVYIAGAKIERAYGFGPLPGCATMVTLVSHGDRCCVGVNLDPAAVTEPERFARCLVEGFEEILALAEDSGPVVLRT